MANKFNPAEHDLKEQLVALNRVSKTVKGGRIARFAAIMVVGDGNGHVGYGLGKAAEVPEAIRKGIEDAKKNMIEVSLKGSTIPHEVLGQFGRGQVLLMPAEEVESGEIVILEVQPVDEETENYLSVGSEKILDAVYAIFKERYKDVLTFED